MMTSGKSALRKKRFTRCPGRGYQRHARTTGRRHPRLRAGQHERFVENADVREIPVPLGEVEPVPDHEAVLDLEARVAHRHVDLAPLGLRQERADLEAGWLPRLGFPGELGKGE